MRFRLIPKSATLIDPEMTLDGNYALRCITHMFFGAKVVSAYIGCHFHVHFSNPWHALASHGLPALAELLVFFKEKLISATYDKIKSK